MAYHQSVRSDSRPKRVTGPDIQDQLQRILDRLVLQRSAGAKRLLKLIIELHLKGDTELLVESALLERVYDREPTEDETILRQQMSRLRKKLGDYYDTEGRTDPLVIRFPPGVGYVPQYYWNGDDEPAELERPTATKERLSADGNAVLADPSERPSGAAALVAYLDRLIQDRSRVPAYFPSHLWQEDGLEDIRQCVRIVRDRKGFEHWRSGERERQRSAGFSDAFEYLPYRSRPEFEELIEDAWMRGPEVMEWEQVRTQERHIVVLGDPGFGKSWLLWHEARRLARNAIEVLASGKGVDSVDEVPLFIRLTKLNPDALELEPRRKTVEQAVLDGLRGGGVEAELLARFRRMFEEGRMTLLLDGWDEVQAGVQTPDGRDPREPLRDKIAQFASRYRGRIILTCRGSRYWNSPMPNASEIEILAFDQSNVRGFAERWFGKDRSRFVEFKEALDGNARVGGLARIPLLLSLMCRVYRGRNDGLPERRGELYEKVLHGLLFDWRKADKSIWSTERKRKMLVGVLAKLAWALQLREEFDDSFLAEALGFDPADLRTSDEADRWIDELVRTGVLVRVGNERLSFLHRSFQEYLTALGLSERRDVLKRVDELSLDPMWHEVIVLLGGVYGARDEQFRQDDVIVSGEMLVGLLRNERDDCPTKRLCPRLALTGRVLAEVFSEDSLEQAGFFTEIFRLLWDLWKRTYRDSVSGAYDHVRGSLATLLVTCPRFQRSLNEDVLAAGNIGVFVPSIVMRLIQLTDSEDSFVRRKAEEGLRCLRPIASGGGTDYLKGLLVHGDGNVRSHAAYFLGRLGPSVADEVVEPLVGRLDDPDPRVPRLVAWSLGNLGRDVADRVVGPLTKCLGSEDSALRARSIEAIGNLGSPIADKLLGRLLEHLEDKDSDVCRKAAEALGKLGPDVADRAVGPLVKRASYADREAVEALRKLDASVVSDRVVGPLLERLHDEERLARWEAALLLAALGQSVADVSNELVGRLVEGLADWSCSVRQCVAMAIGNLGPHVAKQVVGPLLQRLDDDDSFVGARAAEALGGLGPIIADKAVGPLLEHLSDPYPPMRAYAAGALGKLGPAVADEVIGPLLEHLGEDDELVHASVAMALGNLGPGIAEEAAGPLLQRLGRDDDYVRWCAAEALGKITTGGLIRFRPSIEQG